MFVVLGLVIGSLVGFVTSLLRFRAFRATLAMSNVLGGIVVAFALGALYLTKASPSGDGGMAMVTILVVAAMGLATLVAISLVMGVIIGFANKELFIRNARTILVDCFLLSVASIAMQAAFLTPLRNYEIAHQNDEKAALQRKMDSLVASMPEPFKHMPPEAIDAMAKQSEEDEKRGIPKHLMIPTKVVEDMREVMRLSAEASKDTAIKPYMRDNTRRTTSMLALNASWFVSALVLPFVFRSRIPVREALKD